MKLIYLPAPSAPAQQSAITSAKDISLIFCMLRNKILI